MAYTHAIKKIDDCNAEYARDKFMGITGGVHKQNYEDLLPIHVDCLPPISGSAIIYGNCVNSYTLTVIVVLRQPAEINIV